MFKNFLYPLMRICEFYFKFWLCALLLAMVLYSSPVKAQETARYNRFQYHKYTWKVFHGKGFHVYFPAKAADSLYRFVASETTEALTVIKKATLKELPKNINIIIYPSADQLYETNIGAFETHQFTYPTFVFKGTRVVVAYDGSYAELRLQLYEGLARALWESQIRNTGAEDPNAKVKKTAVSGAQNASDEIPFWFKEGTIRFFAKGWTITDEDKLRRSFEKNNFTDYQQLLEYEPRLGGQAFCYFLTQQYYAKVVAQVFFQVKKKNSLARGIRLVAKKDLNTLYADCYQYYYERYNGHHKTEIDNAERRNILIEHGKGIVQAVMVNAKGSTVAYLLLHKGNRSIYIFDTVTKATSKIANYKMPPWIDDHSKDHYPLLQWSGDGKQLYAAMPRKGKITIGRFLLDGSLLERTVLVGVDGLTSFQVLSDRDFLLSAYRRGQSDIVSYDDNHERYIVYTDDSYDDTHPLFTGKGKEVLFVSERPEQLEDRKTYLIGVGYKHDTLKQGIYTIKDKLLHAIAVDSVAYIHWDKPVLLNDSEVLVTTTKEGFEQSMLLNYVTGSTTNLGAYSTFQYLQNSHEIATYRTTQDSISIAIEPLSNWLAYAKNTVMPGRSAWLDDFKRMEAAQAKEDSLLKRARDTTHYFLDNVFASRRDSVKIKGKKGSKKKSVYYGDPNVEPYILQLHSAYFTAQVNNDYFINRYQPYLNYQGQFKFPEVGGITKGGFTDLLENHHFTIAYKLPAATEGSDFFVRYENTERKVDWGLSYFRKVEALKPDPKRNWVDENGNKYPGDAKGKTHNYELFIKYPITYNSYAGFQTALRQDKTIFLATDKYSLDFLPIQSAWSISTFSYLLNRLQATLPSLHKGFKVVAFTDLFKGFDRDEAFVFGVSAHLTYHRPIFKFITLVTQLHLAYSGGDEKILYNMGGTDNNLTPMVDTSIHFAQNAPYAFQTLVTPFRGYYQNSLYGNEYLLFNADVYFPVFKTLIPLVTPLSFINNLQLSTFADVGTARETWLPARAKSLWSYGLGARTTLAGYPLKLELAWPGTFTKKPIWYFSLSL